MSSLSSITKDVELRELYLFCTNTNSGHQIYTLVSPDMWWHSILVCRHREITSWLLRSQALHRMLVSHSSSIGKNLKGYKVTYKESVDWSSDARSHKYSSLVLFILYTNWAGPSLASIDLYAQCTLSRERVNKSQINSYLTYAREQTIIKNLRVNLQSNHYELLWINSTRDQSGRFTISHTLRYHTPNWAIHTCI